MKSLSVFLCLLAVGALMTACEKEAANDLDLVDSKIEVESETDKLVNSTIQYTTLEEMNEVFAEFGLPAVTLEELGVTKEEYLTAQERISNGEIAQSRATCPFNIRRPFNTDGDFSYKAGLSGKNGLSTWDIALAQIAIVNNNLGTTAAQDFGTLSWTWGGDISTYPLTTSDLVLAQRFVLGILC